MVPITHEFGYYRPATVAQATRLLSRHQLPAVLAGGTDLVNLIKEELLTPDVVIDIKRISRLHGIRLQSNRLDIGPLVTFTDIIESGIIREKFPLLQEMAKTVASPAVRNRATLAGNICSAVPSLDSGPLLLVYEAQVATESIVGRRRIPIAEWFAGPKKTVRQANELVTGISLPLPAGKHAGCHLKLGRYHGEDLAQVVVTVMCLPGHTYRIAFGAVAPVPVRAAKIEALLAGHELNESLVAKALSLVEREISPITDIRASREYRLLMAQRMLQRGLLAAAGRLAGHGPAFGTSLI